MSVLNVLRFPDKRLRVKAKPVEAFGKDIRRLAEDMLETMYAEQGIGLAAVQVNCPQRVVVIDLSAERQQPRVLINPEILHQEGEVESREGCLSVPDLQDTIRRAETIRCSYQDVDGEPHEETMDGMLSICVQHEVDHLNGKLFIDHLSPLKRERYEKKLRKHQKRIAAAAL